MLRYKQFIEKMDDPCWKNYKMVGTKKKNGKTVPNCVPEEVEEVFESLGDELYEDWGEINEETEKDGKKVKLNKPFLTPNGPKKRSVYVKNDKGNVVKVNFGDPNLSIKRDDPDRRRSFRARHHCDTNPGPKWKARYWSCKYWSRTPTTELDKG
jgi:hypothetical protein